MESPGNGNKTTLSVGPKTALFYKYFRVKSIIFIYTVFVLYYVMCFSFERFCFGFFFLSILTKGITRCCCAMPGIESFIVFKGYIATCCDQGITKKRLFKSIPALVIFQSMEQGSSCAKLLAASIKKSHIIKTSTAVTVARARVVSSSSIETKRVTPAVAVRELVACSYNRTPLLLFFFCAPNAILINRRVLLYRGR